MGNCLSSGHSARKYNRGNSNNQNGSRVRRRDKFRRKPHRVRSGTHSVSSYGSPRSVMTEETVYYSDEDHIGSSNGSIDGSHVPQMASLSGKQYSSLRHSNVRRMNSEETPETTLVDKLANWWHSFSLFDGEEDSQSLSNEGVKDGMDAHGRPLDVIIEDDAASAPGCISFLTAAQVIRAQKRFLSAIKAGGTVSKTEICEGPGSSREAYAWAVPDPKTFMVRSKQYMKDKVKIPSACCMYTIVGCDSFSFEAKVDHMAEQVQLPEPSQAALEMSKKLNLPPLLVINLQMPMYPATLFGKTDGETCSLVYYFELNSSCEAPQHAIDMAVRLIEDGVEEDGQRTRDRLKLLPRIVNVEEWGEKAPLSGTELRLVRNYNGKPLLLRPQQRFYLGEDAHYFEVDIDIHKYAYIARRAFFGFIPRLGPAVFENGFVLQGNCEKELPEILLACARVYRIDFHNVKKFPGTIRRDHEAMSEQ